MGAFLIALLWFCSVTLPGHLSVLLIPVLLTGSLSWSVSRCLSWCHAAPIPLTPHPAPLTPHPAGVACEHGAEARLSKAVLDSLPAQRAPVGVLRRTGRWVAWLGCACVCILCVCCWFCLGCRAHDGKLRTRTHRHPPRGSVRAHYLPCILSRLQCIATWYPALATS